MSEDLIRRSDAIKAIEVVDWYHQNRNKDMVSGANSSEHQAWYKADDIYRALEAVPTTEPKRGEWHRSLSDCEEGWVTCNNCGMQFDYYLLDQLGAEIEGVYFTNFCPNCGADMRGKDNE